MAAPPSPPASRGSRLIAFVCAMVGAGAALFAVLVTLGTPDGPVWVVETVAVQFTDFTQPATITVYSFGYKLYSRDEVNANFLEVEYTFWRTLPLAFIPACGVLGWYFGRRISRRRANRRM